MVLAAEEALVAAHSTAVAQLASLLPTEQRLLDAVSGGSGDMDTYVGSLREVLQQRRAQLDALETAMVAFERSCATEDEARRHVKGAVSMPWA